MNVKKSPKKSCIKKSPPKLKPKVPIGHYFIICSITFTTSYQRSSQIINTLQELFKQINSSLSITIKNIEKKDQTYYAEVQTLVKTQKEKDNFLKLCLVSHNKYKILSCQLLHEFNVPFYIPYFNESIFNTSESVLETNVNFSNLLYGLLEKDCNKIKAWTDKHKTYFLDPSIPIDSYKEETIAFRGCEDVVKDKQITESFIKSLKCFTSRILSIDKTIYSTLKKAFGVWNKL